MYSPRCVDRRKQEAEAEFGLRLWESSVDDIEAFNARLLREGKLLFDEQGRADGTQNLTAADAEFILNEQLMIGCDAAYALTRYAYVKDEQNVIRRFKFRLAQRLLFDIICDLEDREAAIEIMILKARQLGMSTLVELLVGLRIIFGFGVNAVIGSADRTKTALMAQMLFLLYDNLPCWLKPKWTRRVESDQGMLVFGALSAGVSFQHGAQASGIARGTTPTVYHLSECASFTDAVRQIEAALFKAVHASPGVFGFLESTGEGDKGWWPDTWRHAKENWHRGRARLCPKFLPWFVGTDIYPTPTWIRTRPVPNDWHPNRDTREHVSKAQLYVASEPSLSKYLGNSWQMPREQQWFWEVNHEEAKDKGIEGIFLQEMAGDDEEALQRSAESVFGYKVMAEIDSRRERDYRAYGLAGQSIEDAHEPPPDDIDYNSERTIVAFQSPKKERYRWELIPLNRLPDEADPGDAVGKLLVWHPPQPRVSYSIGVDTSEGKGQDSTVISVWAIGNPGLPDIQCAEFASPWVSHVEAYAFVMVIGAYYGQFMAQGVTRWKQPYVTIEQVAAVGDTCQLQMQRMGWNNFHRMSRYDSSLKRIMKQKKGQSAKRGWYTYGWSRPILTGNFVTYAQNSWLEINSPYLIDEMKHFEVHVTGTGKEKLEHEDGEHDDRIFSAAMATFAPHDLDPLAERTKKRLPEERMPVNVNVAPPNAWTVTPAQMRGRNNMLTLGDLMYAESSLGRFKVVDR